MLRLTSVWAPFALSLVVASACGDDSDPSATEGDAGAGGEFGDLGGRTGSGGRRPANAGQSSSGDTSSSAGGGSTTVSGGQTATGGYGGEPGPSIGTGGRSLSPPGGAGGSAPANAGFGGEDAFGGAGGELGGAGASGEGGNGPERGAGGAAGGPMDDNGGQGGEGGESGDIPPPPGCTPSARPPVVLGTPTTFTCGDWAAVSEDSFPKGLSLTWGIWGSDVDDVYVGAGTYERGYVVHWDGDVWDYETLPDAGGTLREVRSVWGSSANDIWAFGSLTASKPVLFHKTTGDWQRESVNFAPEESGATGFGAAVLGFGSTVFAGVTDITHATRGRIFRKKSGAWEETQIDDVGGQFVLEALWGTGPTDVYAVGAVTDGPNQGGLLLRFDGCSWTHIGTLPDDLYLLNAMSGWGGRVIVVGSTIAPDPDRPPGAGYLYRAVRLISDDLVHWTRFDSDLPGKDTSDTSVVMVAPDSAIVAGSGTSDYPYGYAGVWSDGAWSESPLHPTLPTNPITGIWKDPGSSAAVLAGGLAPHGGPWDGAETVTAGTCE